MGNCLINNFTIRQEDGDTIALERGDIIQTSFSDPECKENVHLFEILSIWGDADALRNRQNIPENVKINLRLFSPKMSDFVTRLATYNVSATPKYVQKLAGMGLSPGYFGAFTVSVKTLLERNFRSYKHLREV